MKVKGYICHCVIEKYDMGLAGETKARPTVKVRAKTKVQAESFAKSELYRKYGTPKVKINNIDVEKIERL